ncbi:hypothetical protein VII00023_06302 [Vibrio ichthyoenteri ATCC 700023]|uniref:Uncharacterized protein n=1 Tax=Vibrio ichthyoenteri ATCC 700023 TaxID=870968 RepID=F9S1Q2_9VIBR|nr:hypothetical protein [Vibrio ichthyoenteri]EGU41444.1 hypothetical protein VII00023_06302 [Vibrio ichthyoenteri ATCC 700023]
MYIQSLTLHLADEQTRQSDVITSKRALKAALSEILQGVEVDLAEIGEQGIVLPLLIAEAKVNQSQIKFSYDVIDAESGLLNLLYQDDKGKARKKEFGQVSRCDLEAHLEQVLVLGKNAFIEQYFPPLVVREKVANIMALSVVLCAVSGLLSLFFFSDLVWHDEVFEQIWPVATVVYLVSGAMLLPKMLSKQTRERAQMMGQSLPRQIFGLVVGNLVLTCGLMLGGASIWHYLDAKPAQVDIVFADKARDYYGKNCKGSVRLEQFSGSICLENKAYWQVIEAGTQAKATGQLSPIGFAIEAIELK